MKTLKATILKMSIHPDGDHPEWGECSTHITIDQEPGFMDTEEIQFVVSQSFDDIKPGEVRLSIKELEKIAIVAREMLRQWPC
jgi:hypothetical protein